MTSAKQHLPDLDKLDQYASDSVRIPMDSLKITVDFLRVPDRYAPYFPNKKAVFTDIEVREYPSMITLSAIHRPDAGSYWRLLLITPKSVGFHPIQNTGYTQAGIGLDTDPVYSFDHDTIEVTAYVPGEVYQVKLVNAGEAIEEGFQISQAITSAS